MPKRKPILGVLFGGPSEERGISLNSARSLCDHVDSDHVELRLAYVSSASRLYAVSRPMIYANTPDDFEFRLATEYRDFEIHDPGDWLSDTTIVFPAGHGVYFEDGQLQRMLEQFGINYLGASSDVCQRVFDKALASESLAAAGMPAIPTCVLDFDGPPSSRSKRRRLDAFWRDNKLRQAVVKPALGGSSIGVAAVGSLSAAWKHAVSLVRGGHKRVLIQPNLKQSPWSGREFTCLVLESFKGRPVPLIPTEVSCEGIFDFRKKYLPTGLVECRCPPSFGDAIVDEIRQAAAKAFQLLGLRDFARIDGWLVADGTVLLSDINIISGLEQNSFLFQQAARCGLTHRETLRYLLESACRRRGIAWTLPNRRRSTAGRQVRVLFGGATSERQVSVQSGANVWMKLGQSSKYRPCPYLLVRRPGGGKRRIWRLSYAFALYHTVEEIDRACRQAGKDAVRVARWRKTIARELAIARDRLLADHLPEALSWRQFLDETKAARAFVFLALHGGEGEDGTIQRILAERGIPYSGSGPEASAVCMDKVLTKERIAASHLAGLETVPWLDFQTAELSGLSPSQLARLWRQLTGVLKGRSIIVKPSADGCSTGVVRLADAMELAAYLRHLGNGDLRVGAGPFRFHHGTTIEMPSELPRRLLFERFIDTARIGVDRDSLKWTRNSPWIEATVAVLGPTGDMHALQPSITVRSGAVLSREEKFQSGTGVNLTPPPPQLVPAEVVARARRRAADLANALGLRGVARIDAFLHCRTGDLRIIEVNTIPAMTPSTALYHQGFAEEPPLDPRRLLEKVIEATLGQRRERRRSASIR